MKLKQLSLFIENKPGALHAPCKVLADNGISISTLSLADTKFFGVLRLMVRDWERARDVLEQNKFVVKITDVVAVEVDHKSGSLANVLAIFDKYALNVEYMYAFASGFHGKAVLIFRFDDPDAAVAKIVNEVSLMDAASLFASV